MKIDFKKTNGLVPSMIQDHKTGLIYMLGYMDSQALELTKQTGFVHFFSRSKKRIWKKGEESGNTLSVKDILIDCDSDALLIKAELNGEAACHTGSLTCFKEER